METRRWIVAGEYIKTTSAVAGCATFVIGNVNRGQWSRSVQKTTLELTASFRLCRRRASYVLRLPARIGLLILPRPPLYQLVARSVQRVHRRDAQAKADAKHEGRERVLLGRRGVRAVEEQDCVDSGSRYPRQERRNEGAQVPLFDCDRRFSSRIRLVANTLCQHLNPSLDVSFNIRSQTGSRENMRYTDLTPITIIASHAEHVNIDIMGKD